jgi:spore germination cell wall hydrolase CwlJ-like protein
MLKAFLTIALAILPIKSCLAHSEQACLASAVYYEARGESVVGQRAVMDTILNRVKHSGRSICGVVLRKGQFEWTTTKPILPFNQEMKNLLQRARASGRVLLSDTYLFFFHKRLNPSWARKLKCVVIENVKFCREEDTDE